MDLPIVELTPDTVHAVSERFFGRSLTPSPAVGTKDGMVVAGHPEAYLRVGASAAASVARAFSTWDLGDPQRILDFGCGHGRVLRWLKARWPGAHFTATDIDEDGVSFCSERIGASGVVSSIHLDAVNFDCEFDAIWAGSVVTHLPEDKTRSLLLKFASWLRPGGIMVFSSHGTTALDNLLGNGLHHYGDVSGRARQIADEYFSKGYAYRDYNGHSGYGVSFVSKKWYFDFVASLPGDPVMSIADRAWDNHHDIVAIRIA